MTLLGEYHEATAADLCAALEKRTVSAQELTVAALNEAEKHRDLNAFITLVPERAHDLAQAADRTRRADVAGPLNGIPVAVKDMFCVEDVRTTAGSKMLERFVPPYDSAVTSRLWDAGACLIGKTNMDEFAMGSTTLTSAFGPTINPIRGAAGQALIPGGSSGGSAAAVAAGIVPVALGTDTGGSVRQPASMCGVVGVKPTYGRCSRWGIVSYASSFDQAGVFARTVADSAFVLDRLTGLDPRDATSLDTPPTRFANAVGGAVAGLRVGVPREFRIAGLPDDVSRLWDTAIATLERAGAFVTDVSLPFTDVALATYYVLVCAEASSNLARYDGVRYGHRTALAGGLDAMIAQTRAEGFGDEVRRRVIAGTYVLSAGHYDRYYGQGQRVRALISRQFGEVMRDIDVLLFPTSPIPPFAIDDPIGARNPVETYLIDVFTVIANLLGAPAISVPFGASRDGLPLGMQVMGRWLGEDMMFAAAETLFRERDWR